MRFKDQVVVITGAARGIGFATAHYLAGEGAAIAIVDRDPAAGEEAAARLVAGGADVAAFAADVTDRAAVHAAIDAVMARFGKIDVLVNNAGIYPHIPFEQLAEGEWHRIIDVNLTSAYLVTQAVIPLMAAAGYGRVVNTASGVVFNGIPNVSAYASSKAGVIGMTRVLANEYGPRGVTVNAVSPGLVESEGVMEDIEAIFEGTIAAQSVKRRGTVQDIAACVAYIASSEAGFLNGQTINIDGGARFL